MNTGFWTIPSYSLPYYAAMSDRPHPIRRLFAALFGMALVSQGAVSDNTRDRVRSGSPACVAPTYYGERSLRDEWEDRLDALATAAERDLRDYQQGIQPPSRGKALKERIRHYEGHSNEDVAFMERCSVRTVERARSDLGMNSWGHRKARPLTSRDLPAAA